MSVPQEVVQALTHFGQEIIEPEDGIVIIEPEISVTPEQVLGLINSIKGDEKLPLEVGVCNVLVHVLTAEWKKLSSAQQDSVKTGLLSLIGKNVNQKSMSRLADAFVAVYRLSGKQWDALADALFTTSPNSLIGFIFIRFIGSADSTFLNSHSTNINEMVGKLLPISSISVQTGLIVMLSTIDSASAFKGNSKLIDSLWTSLIHIFTEEPSRIEFISPLIADIFEQSPEIMEAKPAIINQTISKIADVKTAEPILQLIPYLCKDSLMELINKLFSVFEQSIKSENVVPSEFISLIDNSPLDSIKEENVKAINDFLQSKLETPAGLALFAPFAAQVSTIIGEKELIRIIESCFSQSPIVVCMGLKIYECLSGYSADLDFDFPTKIIVKIINLLISPEEIVRHSTYDTIGALIENEIEMPLNLVKKIFTNFPQVPETDHTLYFKLIRKLLRSEEIEATVMKAALNLAIEVLKKGSSSTPMIQAQCLSIICIVGGSDLDELIYPEIGILSPLAQSLINSNEIETYTYASRALVLFGSIAQELTKRPIISLVPRLFEISHGDMATNPKVQANVGVAYASIVIKLEIKKEYENILELIRKYLDSNESHLINSGSMLGELLRETSETALLTNAYSIIAAASLKYTDHLHLNSSLDALRKILKKFKINQSNVMPLVTSLLNGTHPVYDRKPPSTFVDRDTRIFRFLEQVIISFPATIKDVQPIILQWTEETPYTMLSNFLTILDYLVDNDSITGEVASHTAHVLVSRLSSNKDSVDEILLGITMKLVRKDQSVYDKDQLIARLSNSWAETTNEEVTGWRAALAAAILELGAMGAEMTDDVMLEILGDYPCEPEFGKTEIMSRSLVLLVDRDSEKEETQKNWQGILPAIAKSLADVLLLTKEQQAEHALEKETVANMKRVLRSIIAANRSIEREITKQFNKNRQLLNRFNALLK